jgi:nucleotidyltransferase substrate binding protein (TIGR01987 family)
MELKEVTNQIDKLKKAYKSFQSWIERKKIDDLERDWIIQRFEFLIEITWKTLKKIIKYEGWDDKLFPKESFRVFYERWIIDKIEIWFKFLESRNILSHDYNEELSEELFKFIKENYKEFEKLINKINSNFGKIK